MFFFLSPGWRGSGGRRWSGARETAVEMGAPVQSCQPPKENGPSPSSSLQLSFFPRGPVKGGVFWQSTIARASRRRCQVGSIFLLPFHRRATKNYSKDSRVFRWPTRLSWQLPNDTCMLNEVGPFKNVRRTYYPVITKVLLSTLLLSTDPLHKPHPHTSSTPNTIVAINGILQNDVQFTRVEH